MKRTGLTYMLRYGRWLRSVCPRSRPPVTMGDVYWVNGERIFSIDNSPNWLL